MSFHVCVGTPFGRQHLNVHETEEAAWAWIDENQPFQRLRMFVSEETERRGPSADLLIIDDVVSGKPLTDDQKMRLWTWYVEQKARRERDMRDFSKVSVT